MPDFWRKELWHPVTVHFPIALLLVATFFLLTSFFCKSEYKKLFSNGSFILLLLGVAGAWVGIYTGDLADGIVARKLCDPTVLKDHELAAQTMTYLIYGSSSHSRFVLSWFVEITPPRICTLCDFCLHADWIGVSDTRRTFRGFDRISTRWRCIQAHS